MDRVPPWGFPSRRHNVTHFNGCTRSHAGPGWSNGSENGSNHARRWLCVDGQRLGASSADALEKRFGASSANTVEEWLGTGSADALEERFGTSTPDAVERFGSGSADTLVRRRTNAGS